MREKKTENRGRKPAEDPKQMLRIWVKASLIKSLGGEESAKEAALDGIILGVNKKKSVRQ